MVERLAAGAERLVTDVQRRRKGTTKFCDVDIDR